MNLTVKFEGHVAEVIEKLIKNGVVATKTEALRLGVLELERKYLGSIGAARKEEEEGRPQIVKKHDAAYR
jgi:Arc/MetJ-type ribon-helix-helix transcriptional regulator